MERKVNLETVLHLVNRIRSATRMKPLKALPKGVCNDAEQCVLANALNAGIDGYHIYFYNISDADVVARMIRKGRNENQVVMPITLQNFVDQFDDHQFPELELR